MPSRSFSANSYRYGFNGKENEKETVETGLGTQDYGMRIYNPALGRFLSADPITAAYSDLTPYQFAANTPIQAIDLDGLEAFFIHGTWGNNDAWLTNGEPNELVSELQGLFGNSASYAPTNEFESQKRGVNASWSGGNTDDARQQAAKDMVQFIKKHRIHGEPITLVGHSHGGNVAILVANMLASDPELDGISIQLLTMNTPAREYQLSVDAERITTHYHVYNTSDVVQTSGGNKIKIGSKPGELFGAGREFSTANNIKYESPARKFDINGNHQGWNPASYNVWLPQLKKEKAEKEDAEKPARKSRPMFDCFVKGTLITMGDGSMKPIEQLVTGDKVLNVNLTNLSIEEDEIVSLVSPIHDSILSIDFSDGSGNRNTFDHPYFVKGKGWASFQPLQTLLKYGINVSQLQIGDICLKYEHGKLTEVKLTRITNEIGNVQTYNISRLKRNKSYFANGILVNNEEK